jgi:transposase
VGPGRRPVRPAGTAWGAGGVPAPDHGRGDGLDGPTSARLLLAAKLPSFPRLRALVADRGYRGLAKQAAKRGLALDIKAPPRGVAKFVPIRPLVKVEHAFAQLGRWRRLSRCYEQTEASAQAWVGVAAMGYLFARMRIEPA